MSLCLTEVTGTSLLTLTRLSGFSMMFLYMSSPDLVILMEYNGELGKLQEQERLRNRREVCMEKGGSSPNPTEKKCKNG